MSEQSLMDQFNYANWRFTVWMEGYGSYQEIDQAVKDGKLKPGEPWKKSTKANIIVSGE